MFFKMGNNHENFKNSQICSFFCFLRAPALADKPILTIYTYDSFTSDWGPGPAVETEFEKICECDLQFVV